MANGRPLNDSAMTIAIWRPGKPQGQHYLLTNLKNGKTVIAHWTDRGPGQRARSRGTIADLTPAVFAALGGKLRDGKIQVKIEQIEGKTSWTKKSKQNLCR
jgi:rare lipoprotein A (peptidoglycan hydrolase)